MKIKLADKLNNAAVRYGRIIITAARQFADKLNNAAVWLRGTAVHRTALGITGASLCTAAAACVLTAPVQGVGGSVLKGAGFLLTVFITERAAAKIYMPEECEDDREIKMQGFLILVLLVMALVTVSALDATIGVLR